MALSLFYTTTQLSLLINFGTAAWLRAVQVVGLGFLFVPITLASYVGIPQEKSNMVSGMVNFMRNIGSGVGTSMVTTLIARRAQFHQSILVGNVTEGNPAFLNKMNGQTNRMAHYGYSGDQA